MHGYSSPFALGHKALEHFWEGPVVVQEKIDGSQISFGVYDNELLVRSHHGNPQHSADSGGMFDKGLETAESLYPLLHDGWTYRGEYLQKNKQNALKYDRIPKKHIILFDIDIGDQDYMLPDQLKEESERLGLECVPLIAIFHENPGLDNLKSLLERESILGRVKIEGIVMKNYHQYAPDKKVLMAKLVSKDFQEIHTKAWAEANPKAESYVLALAQSYATTARWQKAVQHLREQGVLQDAPQDIPLVMGEINHDILKECTDEIKDKLFNHFWKEIARTLTRGAPEWYKEQLKARLEEG